MSSLLYSFTDIPISLAALKMGKAKRKQLFLERTQDRRLPGFYCHFKAKPDKLAQGTTLTSNGIWYSCLNSMHEFWDHRSFAWKFHPSPIYGRMPCALCSFVPRISLLFPALPDLEHPVVLIGPSLSFSECHMRVVSSDTQFKLFMFPFQYALTSSGTATGARQSESYKCLDATFSIFFRYPWLIHPVWANAGFLIAMCLESQQVPKPPSKGHCLFQVALVLPLTSLSLSDST